MKLTALITLAGFSKRMGSPKQHMMLVDRSFLETISDVTHQCQGIQKRVFVGQENDYKSASLVTQSKDAWVINPQPELGPLSSIRLALAHIDKDSAIMLWPVDHPMISLKTVSELILFWETDQEKITVPSDGKRRGHPTIFPAWCQKYFFEIDLHEGAKKILQMFPDRISYLMTDDPWPFKNINTPEILAEARRSFNKD